MANNLINKSQINTDSALILYDKTYYCSSVHCSYYSCIQLMMHIIYYKIGYDDQKIRTSFESLGKAERKGGLHGYYINLINIYLKAQKKDAMTFNKLIFKLKTKRTDADYLDIEINEDHARYARFNAIDVNKILVQVI